MVLVVLLDDFTLRIRSNFGFLSVEWSSVIYLLDTVDGSQEAHIKNRLVTVRPDVIQHLQGKHFPQRSGAAGGTNGAEAKAIGS